MSGDVNLYDKPEICIECLKEGRSDCSILCSVYPALNEIVFRNLDSIRISDCFTYNTYPMVVAARPGTKRYASCCSHPAPVHLLRGFALDPTLVDSNASAARLCSEGQYDLCVTTSDAAERWSLEVIRNFEEVPMAWVVFERREGRN
jgi:hypothetical protein